MRVTNTKATPCPSCGHELNAASSLPGDHTPSPGDVSVCLECCTILVFTADMGLRLPTGDEMLEIAGDREVIELIEHIGKMRQEWERKKGMPLYFIRWTGKPDRAPH